MCHRIVGRLLMQQIVAGLCLVHHFGKESHRVLWTGLLQLA